MQRSSPFSGRTYGIFLGVALVVVVMCVNGFAQYRGAPVKLDRLIQTLKSKQVQSRDIVAIIRSNGVNFILTGDARSALIAAGARPEVIAAIAGNQRTTQLKGATFAGTRGKKPDRVTRSSEYAYNDLLAKATTSYKQKKDSANAVRFLQAAIRMKPEDAKAYQMMGMVSLYGLEDLETARQYMRASIANGGSAVFRVYHDDNGNFRDRCTGTLYVSADFLRFESDDNIHTFETSTANIQSVKGDTESSKLWKKHPVFNVLLKFGKEKAKFRFAPVSGTQVESNMAAYFVSTASTITSRDGSLAQKPDHAALPQP